MPLLAVANLTRRALIDNAVTLLSCSLAGAAGLLLATLIAMSATDGVSRDGLFEWARIGWFLGGAVGTATVMVRHILGRAVLAGSFGFMGLWALFMMNAAEAPYDRYVGDMSVSCVWGASLELGAPIAALVSLLQTLYVRYGRNLVDMGLFLFVHAVAGAAGFWCRDSHAGFLAIGAVFGASQFVAGHIILRFATARARLISA